MVYQLWGAWAEGQSMWAFIVCGILVMICLFSRGYWMHLNRKFEDRFWQDGIQSLLQGGGDRNSADSLSNSADQYARTDSDSESSEESARRYSENFLLSSV